MTSQAEATKARLVCDEPKFKPCITFHYGGVFIIGEIADYMIGVFGDKTKLLKKGSNADLDAAFAKPREKTIQVPADYVPPF